MVLKKARSVFSLNWSYSHELAKKRPAKINTNEVRALLGDPKPEVGIELPMTLLKGNDILIVVVSELGRHSTQAKDLSRELADAGFSVLSVDLRGWGDTKPDTATKRNFACEDFIAWRSIEL